ncbi:DNA-binding transcriptional dual regulator [Haemophilus influenzae]|uniref:DNA-binding transcriptional dual regulator n=1 Tax=Haemophilus influenzae TaxID=727 RepID=A0A2X1QKY3_HAEIF|nr:DNA-binding transcriptional dual regulator [Haemophilus influenzae]
MVFDAITQMQHPSFAQALETAMVCEIPFDILDDLAGKMPKTTPANFTFDEQ